jgi:hypothetical protein
VFCRTKGDLPRAYSFASGHEIEAAEPEDDMATTGRALVGNWSLAAAPRAVCRTGLTVGAWLIGSEGGWVVCTFVGLAIAAALT